MLKDSIFEQTRNNADIKTSPIQPPITPSSSLTTSSSKYSLFEFSPASQILKDYPEFELFRKHSINGDNADFIRDKTFALSPSYDTPTFLARRASAPNHTIINVCFKCSSKHQPLSLSICGQHQFCHSCQRTKECSVCPKMITPYNLAAKEYIPSPYNPFQSYLPSSYPCAKLKNIPWDVSQNDIRSFFGNCRLPSSTLYAQSIHILMDRTTGKTLSDAYVEFASTIDLWRAIETRSEKSLKGRIITVSECSQEELLSVIFPKWRGQFQGNMAIPPTSDIVKTMSTAAGGGVNSGCPPFITREEINSLLVVCKNYKLHFSRKCAERPFENIITVITKYPWHQAHLITTIHRDHVFELLKLSIESLKIHLSKDYIQIDPTLLERLVHSGIMCPAFTERQKTTLLQTSRLECPANIVSFLYPLEPIYSAYHSPSVRSATVPVEAASRPVDYLTYLANSNNLAVPQIRSKRYTPHLSKSTDSILADQENTSEEPFEDDDLATLSISSLIYEIQQNCHLDQTKKPVHEQTPIKKEVVQQGIPLLFHPLESKLSPWAPAYSSSNNSNELWPIPSTSPVLESNKLTSSKVLAA
ncbi:hypothetical protein G6F46_001421 [Rhizopus delemar]|nr:hypothetical protein G6F55_001381 [Rhizopus delemar]KAG1521114.1 hypothetical protein G6F52_007034 [Rhizopus delemar]KAG1621692.1 hypothetical protein G6F46_001421 [Rhizopus delemar]